MSGIVEFNMSDGIPPLVMQKLNANFQNLIGAGVDHTGNIITGTVYPDNATDGAIFYNTETGDISVWRNLGEAWGWSSATSADIAGIEQAVQEALELVEAIDQHFWTDTQGAHVTDITQDEWQEEITSDDPFDDVSDSKQYSNLLLNSLGILLRSALNNLVSITRSAISFFDGHGNNVENVVAAFGRNGARVGKTDGMHSIFSPALFSMMYTNLIEAFRIAVRYVHLEYTQGGYFETITSLPAQITISLPSADCYLKECTVNQLSATHYSFPTSTGEADVTSDYVLEYQKVSVSYVRNYYSYDQTSMVLTVAATEETEAMLAEHGTLYVPIRTKSWYADSGGDLPEQTLADAYINGTFTATDTFFRKTSLDPTSSVDEYKRVIESSDINNDVLGNIVAGREASSNSNVFSLEAVNGSNQNTALLKMSDSGVAAVWLSHPAAWRSALSLNNLTLDVISVTGTGKNTAAISSNTNCAINVTYTTPSGYTPIGIRSIALGGTGNSWLVYRRYDIASSSTVMTAWRNVTSSNIAANAVTVTVEVYCIKTTLS